MNKILIITIIIAIAHDANAAQNCCNMACMNAPLGTTISYDASCYDTNVCNCSGTTETELSGGVIEIKTKTRKQMCSASYVASTSCYTKTTYKCARGYYGLPTELNKKCTRCPSSGGIYGTTSGSGATSITECYIESGSTGSDSTGSYTYTGNCYYSN